MMAKIYFTWHAGWTPFPSSSFSLTWDAIPVPYQWACMAARRLQYSSQNERDGEGGEVSKDQGGNVSSSNDEGQSAYSLG